MPQQDWRAALGSLAEQFSDSETTSDTTIESHPECQSGSSQSSPLHIALERKGRGGKTATIIFGFTIDEDSLKELAADIKRSLGCGGSARRGEILIQGDRVADCRKLLSQRGYRIK